MMAIHFVCHVHTRDLLFSQRPWHELESNYQITFKVGIGVSPPFSENLGEEGKDFLSLRSQTKHMLRALKRTALVRQYF